MKNCKEDKKLEALLFEKSKVGRQSWQIPNNDCPEYSPEGIIPTELIRDDVKFFPEMSENEVVRHYTRLSMLNYSIDAGMYPLGSCTMKYNPVINEVTARISAFTESHPMQEDDANQGNLELMWTVERYLAEIAGLPGVTLQPAAGAHGELTGMMIIKAYHLNRNNDRKIVLVPDSAHGTNPSSATLAGFKPQVLPSNSRGLIDLDILKEKMTDNVAAVMITNPNTLGLFEENILEIASLVHERGGLIYGDGANMNAMLGIARPGDIGVDVLHFNLHKTFSTPHGGGGPGSGPVAVRKNLIPFLPSPVIYRSADGVFSFLPADEKSIGKVSTFYGNFGVVIRALTYLLSIGASGLKRVSEIAVLNANYIRQALKEDFYLPYDRLCKHECVFNDKFLQEFHVSTLDVAKRLIDYGFHPPTIYFPLIVKGALMIEPTETESPENIDNFINTLKKIAEEAKSTPELVKNAPHCAPLKRLDEVTAARKPKLRYNPEL